MPLPDRIHAALHQVPPPPPGDPVAAIRRGRQRARRRQLRNGAGSLACVAALTVAAVVWWPDSSSGTPDIADQADATCPVTEPDPGTFTPPDPYRTAEPGVEGGAWFGTADLWTVVSDPAAPSKSVWWSIHFDVSTEEQPDIEVVHERLDAPDADPVVFEGPGTNAFTEEQGWFMIAGLQPDEPGCWRTTATYRDTELTITTLVEDGDAPTVLDLPAPDTVAPAFVDGHPVFVVRDADGQVRVLDAVSPHLPRFAGRVREGRRELGSVACDQTRLLPPERHRGPFGRRLDRDQVRQERAVGEVRHDQLPDRGEQEGQADHQPRGPSQGSAGVPRQRGERQRSEPVLLQEVDRDERRGVSVTRGLTVAPTRCQRDGHDLTRYRIELDAGHADVEHVAAETDGRGSQRSRRGP